MPNKILVPREIATYGNPKVDGYYYVTREGWDEGSYYEVKNNIWYKDDVTHWYEPLTHEEYMREVDNNILAALSQKYNHPCKI